MNAKERAEQLLKEKKSGPQIAKAMHDEEFSIEDVHDVLFNQHFIVSIEDKGGATDRKKMLHVAPRPEPGPTIVIVVEDALHLPGVIWEYSRPSPDKA